MELTTFTTAQIYSIFAALSCAAVSGILFYCLGLRTGNAAGYELGRSTAKTYWINRITHIRSDLGEARDLLDARSREMAALRQSIEQETADHAMVERNLLNRLAEATQLVAGDHATLLNVAGKLQLAASTFAGIGAHDHAHTCSNLKSQVLDMAARAAQANAQPHPDSELLDWLDENATVHFDLETAELRFQAFPTNWLPFVDDLRTLLRQAKADSDDIDQHGAEALRLAVQEDAA